MNCQEVENLITDLARGVETNDAALAHVKECRGCGERLADEERLTAGLLAVARASAAEQAPPVVEEKLREAFRRRTAPVEAPAPFRRGWIALAAAGSIAASVMLFRMFSSTNPVAPAVRVPVEPRRVASVTASPPEPAPVTPPRVKIRSARRRALPVLDPKPAPAEGHFLAVAQGDGWTPLDGGRVVRVKLPRSALLVFGLPMNEERALEQVQADVMLSNDGLLRAIRFVQ